MTLPPTPDGALALNSLGLARPPGRTRVVVAMSGGVDSSVVAGLLAREGYEVIGITLQLYDHGAATAKKGACCAGRDVHDARRVAQKLGIAHYVLDYESRFRDAVVEEFADSYLAGETPVPCIRCNQRVKFADLLATARDLGADALATGHYIVSRPLEAPSAPGESARMGLYCAADEGRDQSYFLFATTQAQLDFLRFPLGALSKDEVRRLAAELGLEVAAKPDSQDICFVPDGRYGDVIAKLRPEANRPGAIVHMDGRVLGSHDGIVHFTVGQRRGLGIAHDEPLYVVALKPECGEVIVGPRAALEVTRVFLREVNWLGDAPLEGLERAVFVKLRSTQAPVAATLVEKHGEVTIALDDGEFGISPGQACVFYDAGESGARVLGGGWIAGTDRGTGISRKSAADASAGELSGRGAKNIAPGVSRVIVEMEKEKAAGVASAQV